MTEGVVLEEDAEEFKYCNGTFFGWIYREWMDFFGGKWGEDAREGAFFVFGGTGARKRT